MSDTGLMFILSLPICACVVAVFMVIQYFRGGYHHKAKGCETFGQAVKRCVTGPFYYHFGSACPMCGKNYFSSKKAHMCCPGPHNHFYGDKNKEITYWCRQAPMRGGQNDASRFPGYYGGYNKQGRKWL